MSYPSDQNLLRSLIEAASGSTSETYGGPASPFKHALGSSLSPVMPSGWPLKISGAAPLSAPNAPTAGTPATTTATGHFLASTGTYQWKLTAVTQFGETTPSAALAPGALSAGVTGYNLAMPSVTEGTADAPVLYRKLYRTTNGGSTFYWVADIDLTTTSYLDGKPDGDLEVAAPSTNTSGSTGAVTLTVNGVAGTEMPPGTSLTTSGQFIVDYSLSNTAGTITHYSGDATKTIVATYVGANLLSATLLSNIITGIKSIVTAFGTPNTANGAVLYDTNSNLPILSGHKLVAQGQSGAATGVTSVANQARGAVSIGTGASNGALITYANSLITTTSYIALQPSNTGGYTSMVQSCVIRSVSAGQVQFYIFTNGGAATNGPTDVVVFIDN